MSWLWACLINIPYHFLIIFYMLYDVVSRNIPIKIRYCTYKHIAISDRSNARPTVEVTVLLAFFYPLLVELLAPLHTPTTKHLLAFLTIVLYLVLYVQLLCTYFLRYFRSAPLPVRTRTPPPLVYLHHIVPTMSTILDAVFAEKLGFGQFSHVAACQTHVILICSHTRVEATALAPLYLWLFLLHRFKAQVILFLPFYPVAIDSLRRRFGHLILFFDESHKISMIIAYHVDDQTLHIFQTLLKGFRKLEFLHLAIIA